MHQKPTEITQEVVSILKAYGELDYIGEPVSQMEHSLQCADLAASSGADPQTVVAALLHDIGHFLPPEIAEAMRGQALEDMRGSSSASSSSQGYPGDGTVGRVGHETIGEHYLRSLGFPEKICALVGSHVAAKRYLTATNPKYYESLSDASKRSLELQGGPMEGEELQQWARGPWCAEMCQLRRWDDAAKIVGLEVPGVESYARRIEQCLGSSMTCELHYQASV